MSFAERLSLHGASMRWAIVERGGNSQRKRPIFEKPSNWRPRPPSSTAKTSNARKEGWKAAVHSPPPPKKADDDVNARFAKRGHWPAEGGGWQGTTGRAFISSLPISASVGVDGRWRKRGEEKEKGAEHRSRGGGQMGTGRPCETPCTFASNRGLRGVRM